MGDVVAAATPAAAEAVVELKVKVEVEVKVEEAKVAGEAAVVESAAPAADVKSEEEPSPELMEKITKLLEFYFGNANFRRDRFLKSEAAKDPKGMVAIKVLLTFNKLKSFTTNAATVAAAAEASAALTVSEDKAKIGRATPLPETDDSDDRTVFVRGLGNDPKKVTIDAVIELFKDCGTVALVRLHRHSKSDHGGSHDKEGKLKGSCYIEFETKEGAAAAVAGKDDIKWHGKKLDKIESLADHKKEAAEREAEYKKKVAEKEEKKKSAAAEGGGDGVKKEGGEEGGAAVEGAAAETKDPVFEKGNLVAFAGCGKESSWKDIKETLGKFGKVGFVQYTDGDDKGIVRMNSPEDAKVMVEGVAKAEEGLTIGGEKVTVSIVEGDAEMEFYRARDLAKAASGDRDHRGGAQKRRGGGGGGRGRGNKRQKTG